MVEDYAPFFARASAVLLPLHFQWPSTNMRVTLVRPLMLSRQSQVSQMYLRLRTVSAT